MKSEKTASKPPNQRENPVKKREFSRAWGTYSRTLHREGVPADVGGGDVFAPNISRSMGHAFAHIAHTIISHVFARPTVDACPVARSLLLPAAFFQREAKELLQQLKLEKELADGESATKRARKRKAGEAVDAADTLPDRQPEDLDTQQNEVADVKVDSEAEALAAEADLEAGAHEAARVVAARKAADAQLALEDSAFQEAAACLYRANRESVFVSRLLLGRKPAQPAAGDSACFAFHCGSRFACRSLQTLAHGQQMLLAQMDPGTAL